MKIKTNKSGSGSAEILITFDWSEIAKNKEAILKDLQKNYEVDGFRKGNVPTDVIVKNMGEMAIYEMCVEDELNKNYPQILKDEKVDALGRPMVTILKLAIDNPVEAKIETAIYPEFKLPEYKKIARENLGETKIDPKSFTATDEDLTKTFNELQHMRAHQNLHSEGGHDHNDHSHGEITPDMYPELNDEFAKSFGFKDLDEMRTKARENIVKEKTQKHTEKIRIGLIEKLIEKTEIEIPKILIDSELDAMLHRMRHDISMMGMEFNEYLKHINKTEADLKNEYENDAKKRVASKLIIEQIAKDEKIKPTDAEIEIDVQKLMAQYPDADKLQTTMYVESVLTTEKVFNFLENQK